MKKKVLILGGPWEKQAQLKSMLVRLKYTVLESGRASHSEAPDLVLLDMRGEEPPVWERLHSLKQEQGETPVIVVGEKKIDYIVTAMKMGASNYMSEPFDAQDLKSVLMNIIDEHHLVSEIAALNEIAKEQPSWLLSSSSPAMNEVKKIVEQVAGTDVTVLIRGESGTGKGVVARAIYLHSRRREMPFVKINCAALPKELLESELFGYEKGAFTGAYQRKAGKFGLAHEGTIFLDEISEMHSSLQAKLLHVLETGEFSRLGGRRTRRSTSGLSPPRAAISNRLSGRDSFAMTSSIGSTSSPSEFRRCGSGRRRSRCWRSIFSVSITTSTTRPIGRSRRRFWRPLSTTTGPEMCGSLKTSSNGW
ncbi:MAG: sigma-54-dependent Fis family transcriptional regulator [Candidatus Manganitrophus sp.]|nr:sigma-54-dependent Fis family transcriptional regulator [Candidatus Manganitrophus sp.]